MGAVGVAMLAEAGAGAANAAPPPGRKTLYGVGAGAAAPIVDAPYDEYGRGTAGALFPATGP
mgnify:CR=1 FL=1